MSEFTLIEASNGAKPKVVGVAYSGGKMSLPGWRHPVVVDLAGMEIPESVPLLTNHENKTDSRIGLISAAVRNNALEITMKEIMVEGLLSIQAGENPRVIEEKLKSFLSPQIRENMGNGDGGAAEGGEA